MSGWWIAAFGVLAAVVVVQSVINIAIYRLVGVLLNRLGPNYARAFRELPWGDEVPVHELISVEGARKALTGRRALIAFVSPTCGVCREVAPSLKALAPTYLPTTRFLVVVEGNRREATEWDEVYGFEGLEVFSSNEQPAVFARDINSPYGILIDPAGIVVHHGVVNDREMLESLLVTHEHDQHSLTLSA